MEYDYQLNELATRMESEKRPRDEEYDGRPPWRWTKNANGKGMAKRVVKVVGLLAMFLGLK
jgi:hypothetical protein